MSLRAYFDESGTHKGASVLTVGGCIAHVEAWDALAKEWRAAMTDYRIDHFHMNKFENRRAPFSDWPENRRIPRLNRLMTIINRNTIASAGMSIDRAAYDRILPQEMKDRVRGPYGMALKACLASLKRLHKQTNMTEPIDLVFACGADQAAAIERETMAVIEANEDESRYINVSFERDTTIPPLQAADIIAYDMCKEVARILGYHARERRKLMARLEERYKYWGYMDDDEIQRFAERNTPEKIRERDEAKGEGD